MNNWIAQFSDVHKCTINPPALVDGDFNGFVVVSGIAGLSASGLLQNPSIGGLPRLIQQGDVQYDDLIFKLSSMHGSTPRAILGIGGGAVIDFAKVLALCLANKDNYRDILLGNLSLCRSALPIFAVPTTAGSGSEHTRFATVFRKEKKYSVEHISLLPQAFCHIPDAIAAAPLRQIAISALDAVSHCIESFWAKSATQESRSLAIAGLSDLWPALSSAVELGINTEVAVRLQRGASLAGQAINISKTTGAHALAYRLTSKYGLPHGHAVSLMLQSVLLHINEVFRSDYNGRLRNDIDRIASVMNANDAVDMQRKISRIMNRVGLKFSYLPEPSELAFELVMAAEENRLMNHPLKWEHEEIMHAMLSVLNSPGAETDSKTF